MAKSSSMLLIGMGPKPKGKDSENSGDEDETKDARLSAVKALFAAVKSGDTEAADEALQTHYDLCAGHMSDEDEEY